MNRNNTSNVNVLVTDSSRGSAISVIRSLGRAGYKVIAADSNCNSIGFRSCYARERVIYPSPEVDLPGFTEFLLNTVKARKIDLIIPVTDLVILPLVSVREQLEEFTRIALPENEALGAVIDKKNTFQRAEKLGVPIPGTFFVGDTEEAMRIAKNLTWPIVLKPQFSKKLLDSKGVESFKVTYALSTRDLYNAMQKIEGRCDVLLQEYHPGVGYGIELLMSDGQPLAAFAHRRLREVPLTGGVSSYRESAAIDSTLYDYALRLLSDIGWTGLAMVEFKRNSSKAVLMEINGRVWGSIPLAVASGVDFPLLLTKLFMDGANSIKPQLGNHYQVGIRCSNLMLDLVWMASVILQKRNYSFCEMPLRTEAIKALISILDPRGRFDLLSLDDPQPAIAELPVIANRFRRKFREL